jgi:hypothetical protein
LRSVFQGEEADVSTTIKRGMVLSLALGGLGLMIAAQLAGATHPRPISATPLRVSLVPAYEQCTSPNRMHGPPLDSPSCNPPAQTSDFLTVGTPDANGAEANSVGYFKLRVSPKSDPNVIFTSTISDVRCKSGTSTCGNANDADGPDYTGELEGNATIRITDHFNGPDGNEAATVRDLPLPFYLVCTNTADTSIGGVCNINTSCPLIPNGCSTVRNGDRTVVGITQIHVFDGGPDGIVGTDGDNTLFMNQGVFIP